MSRPDLRSEDGVTLTELLVASIIGVILSLGLFGFLDTTSKSSEQTAARIDAAKAGRPVIAGIMDRLHSTCLSPDTPPIRAGSGPDNLIFLSQTGSTVSPTPSLYKISFDQTRRRLTEYLYPLTGGTAPDWTFSSAASPTSGRLLLEPVQRDGTTPVFRYYTYGTTGTVSTAPLTVPATGLTADDAARVVQVSVSFEVPSRVSDDTEGATTFADTALLRFTPPAADTGTENLPCA